MGKDREPVNSWWDLDRLQYRGFVTLGQQLPDPGQALGWKDLRSCCFSELCRGGREASKGRAGIRSVHVNNGAQLPKVWRGWSAW